MGSKTRGLILILGNSGVLPFIFRLESTLFFVYFWFIMLDNVLLVKGKIIKRGLIS